MDPLELNFFAKLGVALAIGLLIGSERGWHKRNQDEGTRVAGIRTFTLIALLGSVTAVLARQHAGDLSLLVSTLVFVGIAVLLGLGYVQSVKARANLSMTTEVAAMVTFWLAVLPAYGYALPAMACAVLVALLLHLKERLHHWLKVVDERELLGTLQFLVVSLVLLPLLPNEGFGPWDAINPYQLWWMVVLISGLSLLGYFAMRLAGARRGILATSLTGGLVSSTSVTISLSRLHREIPDTGGIGAGILLACATMFARIAIVVTAIKPSLAPAIAVPMATGFIVLLALALLQFRTGRSDGAAQQPEVRNPFQLIPALQFGLLLGVVIFASHALQHWLGETGLYLLSVATGIADVDAIVLSLAPQSGDELAQRVVVTCIALAAATNTIMKGIYCQLVAGPVLGRRMLGFTLLTGLLVLAYPAALWLLAA